MPLSFALEAAILFHAYTAPALPPLASPRCPLPISRVRLVDGRLPEGIRLSSAGYLRGTPVEAGEFPFTVEQDDGCSRQRLPLVLRVAKAPVLTIDTGTLEFAAVKGEPGPRPRTIVVAGSAPDLPYSIHGDRPEWLRLDPRRGKTPPPGTAPGAEQVTVHVDAGSLPPGSYSARLIFSAPHSANAPVVEVRLRVVTPHVPMPPLPVVTVTPPRLGAPPPLAWIQPPPAPRHRPIHLPVRRKPVRKKPAPPLRSRVMPIHNVQLPNEAPPFLVRKPSPMPAQAQPTPAAPPPGKSVSTPAAPPQHASAAQAGTKPTPSPNAAPKSSPAAAAKPPAPAAAAAPKPPVPQPAAGKTSSTPAAPPQHGSAPHPGAKPSPAPAPATKPASATTKPSPAATAKPSPPPPAAKPKQHGSVHIPPTTELSA